MRNLKQLSLAIAVLLIVSMSSVVIRAQNRGDQSTNDKSVTVTGCLSKGDSPNEFHLIGDDGKRYEVRSDSVSLSDHIGHKVTVTGTSVKESKAEEKQENEKNEARENEAANLQVSDVKMVSSSCK